jgi:hypothetical protein
MRGAPRSYRRRVSSKALPGQEAARMSDAWIVKRRPRRPSAMRRHRFVEAHVAAGHSSVAFPGSPMPEPEGGRERLVSSGTSLLLHGGLVLLLFLLAQLAPEELKEQLIEVTRVNEPREEPAPRPRAIAESSGRFAPAPMALAPQIVNPTVIQQRAPDLSAAQVQLADIQPIQAPRNLAVPNAPEVAQVRAFQSPIVANTAAPRVIDSAAPKLSGPIDFQAPAGTLAGPRQVVTGGSTVGIADPTALGTGSSVREGIASDRDVHGAKTGERASVNVAVGAGGGRGTGGDGLGAGGVSEADCLARPEVQSYLERLRERVISRWRATPSNLPNGTFKVSLRFRLDPSGSASAIEFVSADSQAVGESAADAMRAASPFDQMPDRARCIASQSWTAAFTLETFASAN